MSLATSCPQCKTSFKVVPDQLKLRRGLVRCGICRHVFSGVDFLKYLEDSSDAARRDASVATAPPTPPAPEPQTPPPGAGEPPGQDASPPLLETAPLAAYDAGAEPGIVRPPAERDDFDLEAIERSEREPVEHEIVAREPSVERQPPVEREPSVERASPVERESFTERESVEAETGDREPIPVDLAGHAPGDHQLGDLELADRERADHELGDLAFVDREPDRHRASDPGLDATGSKFDAPAIDDDIFRDTRYDMPPPHAMAKTDRVAATGASATVGTDELGSPDDDAVDFFSTNERAGGFATRASVFAAMAAFVLGIALALQLAIGARDWLAAALPFLRPALVAAAAPLGLSVQPPRQLGALTIESFELQSAGDSGLLSMSALLRNAVSHPVRWPAMELSLTDGSGAVVVRKVLLPADYLAGASRLETDGVAANAEWPLRVALEPQGVEPTAYSVKLFYP